MKRFIAIKRSAAVYQYSQIMSCHVMPHPDCRRLQSGSLSVGSVGANKMKKVSRWKAVEGEFRQDISLLSRMFR